MKKTVLLFSAALLFAASASAQLLNGNMEAWRNYTSGFLPAVPLEAPNSWYGLDSSISFYAPIAGITPRKQIFKSTDIHGGSFAAKIISHDFGAPAGVVPGVLSNAIVNVNPADLTYTKTGGTVVSQRMTNVTAWVKYIPKATSDSATFGVQAVLQGTAGANGQDSIIGGGTVIFGATAAYTQMTATITYFTTATPNRIQIAFLSGKLGTGVDSSTLFVDDVVLNGPSSIASVAFNADVIKCYPNPTTGMLYLSSKETGVLNWEALNATGQVIAQKEFTQNAMVDLGNTPAGIYYFRVFDKNKTLLQTGKFSVQ